MDENMLLEEAYELKLSIRSYVALKRAGVKTVGDLANKTYDDICNIPHIVPKCIDEITNAVHSLGLKFKGE